MRSVWVFDEDGKPLYDKWQTLVDGVWVDNHPPPDPDNPPKFITGTGK